MPRKHIDVSVSHDDFGLEPEYWAGRAQEVERLRKMVHEHSTEEPEQRRPTSGKLIEGIDPGPARGKDFESDSHQ